jgi:hypothetical protein
MKGQLRYRILDEYKLVVVHYSGVLTVDELIDQLVNRNETSGYNPTYNTLYDFRDCTFNVKLAEFERSEEVGRTTPGYNTGKRVALLVKRPKETLLLRSFVKAIQKHKSHFEVFSAMSAALLFVGATLNEKGYIEDILKELKTVEPF